MPYKDIEDLIDICLNVAGRSGKKIKIDPSMCDVCIRPLERSELIHDTPCCPDGTMCNECKNTYKNNIKTCNRCINNSVTITIKGEIN